MFTGREGTAKYNIKDFQHWIGKYHDVLLILFNQPSGKKKH